MPIKVIVELQAAPGRRDDLKFELRNLLADMGPALGEMGCLGSDFYEVIDHPTPSWRSRSGRRPPPGRPSSTTRGPLR